MGLGTIVKGLFGGGGSVIEKVGEVIDNLVTSKEEKEKLKIELAKVMQDHEAKMEELAIKKLEVELGDMANARAREIAVANSGASWLSKNIVALMAIVIIGLTFTIWGIVLFKSYPPESKDLIMAILGSLSTLSMGVISYYFGSSMGSKSKQDMIDKMIKE